MFDSKKLLDALVNGSSEETGKIRQGAGSITDTLGNILKQATEGVKAGAKDANEATGAGTMLDDLVGQLTQGQSTQDLINKAKDLIGDNQAAAGAIAGALGGLLLGTSSGRSIAWSAAKVGGLVLIGGLAYQAYKNYQDGDEATSADPENIETAPDGSGFETAAQTDKNAQTYIRAMIAAAAADGQISQEERNTIFGALKDAGFSAEAAEFLEGEFTNPATPAELAAAAEDQKSALQIYTAARLAIEPDTEAEKAFLASLAEELGLESDLIQHVDNQVSGIKV